MSRAPAIAVIGVAGAGSRPRLFGGIALILGLCTRPAALGVAAVMLGAAVKVHLPEGFFMNWELRAGKGHGYDTNLALLAMALAGVIAGGGALSIDRLLVR